MSFRRDTKLNLSIDTYRLLENRAVREDLVVGIVPPQIDYQALVDCLTEFKLLSENNAVTRQLEFYPPTISDNPFFLKFDAVFKQKKWLHKHPSKFYIADVDVYFDGEVLDPINMLVKEYIDATRLAEMLEGCAEHVYTDSFGQTRLVFLSETKLEVLINYSDVTLVGMPELDIFASEFIDSTTHKEQKRIIINTVLLELFPRWEPVALSSIMAKFGIFWERCKANYSLYVAEFSFEKIKQSVDKEKLELTLKINKVFSEIQNQLLAVPAALLLVSGQMSEGEKFLLKNSLIWIGCFIFVMLMNLLIRNQRHSLRAVKSEIDIQWHLIRSQYEAAADNFKAGYFELEKRYRHQWFLLFVVDLLVATSLAISTGLLIKYSVPGEFVIENLSSALLLGVPLYCVSCILASKIQKAWSEIDR